MRWVRRGLWIGAWAGWAWLGVGLHRELPRHQGTVLRQIPLDAQEQPFGFFDDDNFLASIGVSDDPKDYRVRVWDVRRGAPLREAALSADSDWRFHFSARHGVVVGGIPATAKAPECVGALDLRTGQWTELAPKGTGLGEFHSERPWVSLVLDPGKQVAEVIVADIRTGRRVFTRKRSDVKSLRPKEGCPPQFLPNDEILIPTCADLRDRRSSRFAIERWKIADHVERPEQIYEGVHVGDAVSVSPTGFMVWTEIFSDPISSNVFDSKAGRVVSSFPPGAKAPEEGTMGNFMGQVPHAMLAANGRTIYFEGSIWDIERRTPIWTHSDFENPIESTRGEILQVQEFWGVLLGDWANELANELATWAARDLSTGRVIYRLWFEYGSPITNPDLVSRTHGVWIDTDGTLRPYPPPANIQLLILCQSILALPLILLWLALLWRRKRRERQVEGATA